VEALIVGSILSSVSLVLVNKQIFALGFTHVFALSTLHFVATTVLLRLMAQLGFFEAKATMPMAAAIIVATFGVGSICLMNFSLKLNSVGFYQMLKLAVIPTCLGINFVSYGETASRKVVGALALVLVGVGLATVTDVELNLLGSLFGIGAVLATAQYQIWQGKKQKEFGLSSQQLNLSVSFYQIFVGAALTVVFEAEDLAKNEVLWNDETNSNLISLVGLSCLLAVSVNIHSFALIGKTSAVTFQVVGHGKTCLILLSGYYMQISEGLPLTALYKNLIGVFVALSGVVLYSNLKIKQHGEEDWCDKFLPSSLLKFFSEKPTAV